LLNGEVGQNLKVVVKVSPASEGLFEITGAKLDQGKDVRLAPTGGDETDDKVYTLVIENTKTTPGKYQDMIRLLTTNKTQKEIVIPVWGNIRPPEIASVEPRYVALNGPAEGSIKGTVTIVPKENHSFSITEVKAHSGTFIKWDLKETVESGKKTYTLTVENLKKEKGVYNDTLFLKTDNPVVPQVEIRVSGRITD
jgi:hypothetical protein